MIIERERKYFADKFKRLPQLINGHQSLISSQKPINQAVLSEVNKFLNTFRSDKEISMKTLTRWEPFRELNTVRNMMDRVFDEPFMRMPALWERSQTTMSLALDVMENPDNYVVKASVAGIKPEDIEVTIDNNMLTIKGETKEESEHEDGNYHLQRRSGSFYRSVSLPADLKEDKIEAVNENGVLTFDSAQGRRGEAQED